MKKFKLKESGSSVRTELITGLTPSVAKATMGSGYTAMFLSVVSMFIGLFNILVLDRKRIKVTVLIGMLDEDGNMPNMKEVLIADAVSTIAGACTGTSTVTTFVAFVSGIEAGGCTDLNALTTGVLFLARMFIAPVVA